MKHLWLLYVCKFYFSTHTMAKRKYSDRKKVDFELLVEIFVLVYPVLNKLVFRNVCMSEPFCLYLDRTRISGQHNERKNFFQKSK